MRDVSAFDVGPCPVPTRPRIHDDDAVRPQIGIGEERGGTSRSFSVEIERQHDGLAERLFDFPPIAGGLDTLAADHERRIERQPEAAIVHAGEAGIDPERDAGKRIAESAHELEIRAASRNRIEVRDIENGREGGGEKTAGDGGGIVGLAERACDRTIFGASSRLGMNGDAVLEVEGRNDREVARLAHCLRSIAGIRAHRPA